MPKIYYLTSDPTAPGLPEGVAAAIWKASGLNRSHLANILAGRQSCGPHVAMELSKTIHRLFAILIPPELFADAKLHYREIRQMLSSADLEMLNPSNLKAEDLSDPPVNYLYRPRKWDCVYYDKCLWASDDSWTCKNCKDYQRSRVFTDPLPGAPGHLPENDHRVTEPKNNRSIQ